MITAALIHYLCPACRAPAEWAEALAAAATAWNIDTPLRLAYWLANIAHETAGCTRLEENLNYGAVGLMATWPRRFPDPEVAERYARQPERIANRAYALRLGNGDEASGDGWKYRGRGALQVTGRHNYRLAGAALGIDFEDAPDLLARIDHGCMAAGWFWGANALHRFADAEDFEGCLRAINGGVNGRPERLTHLARALHALDA
jgi:putative chitinase